MRREFAMPDVGEGLTEAEIVGWQVAVGDTVTVNQILCEIETAKAAVELPSPFAGTVLELLAEPGNTIDVGTPIIAIETAEAGGDVSASAASGGEEQGAKIGEAGKDGRIATLVGYGPRPGSVARRPRKAPAAGPGSGSAARAANGAAEGPSSTTSVEASGSASVGPAVGNVAAASTPAMADASSRAVSGSEPAGSAQVPAAGAARRGAQAGAGAPSGGGASAEARSAVPLAKPPVRKLARDLGVDLRAVTPSGADGVITRADVEAFAAVPAAGAPAAGLVAAVSGGAAAAAAGDRREPIRGVRKATAAAVTSSAFTAPHVTEFLAVDVTETMALRDRLRATREFRDVKLTPLAFVAKAVCLAAPRTPELNARWDEPAGEIVFHEHVQLGIAAATPRGLIVPKVRDADTLSLRELALALGELTETARSGKTPPSDLVGGTFTITNVGVFGVDTGTPILNPGEAGILAVGAIKPMPWVVDGELAVRTVCQLALSFDHRLVDGEQGSRFLADVGALLTDPGLALTW